MIDLMPFCSKSELHLHYMTPFSRGEYTYATDGHIIVRVTRRPDSEERKIDARRTFDVAGEKADMIPLHFRFPDPEVGECSYCEGRGTEHECPDCECECEACDGTGKAQEKVSVTIRGAIFDLKYIRLIQSLPNAKFAAVPSAEGPSWFEFEGGDGLIMPMRRPHHEHIDCPEEDTP